MLAHFVVYDDSVGLLQIGALDVGGLVLVAVARVVGTRLGTYVASVAITAIALGLPVVVLGYLAELADGRHLSNLMGTTCLMGIGVGLATACARTSYRASSCNVRLSKCQSPSGETGK